MNIVPVKLTFILLDAQPIIRNWFDQRDCRIEISEVTAFLSSGGSKHVCIRVGYYMRFCEAVEELRLYDEFFEFQFSYGKPLLWAAAEVDSEHHMDIPRFYPHFVAELRERVRALIPVRDRLNQEMDPI